MVGLSRFVLGVNKMRRTRGASAGGSLSISGTPSAATIGEPYYFQPVVTGGTPPYTFTYTADSLAGMTASQSSGSLAGAPNAVGAFANIRVKVEDSANPKNSANLAPFTLLVGDPLGPNAATYQITQPADEVSLADIVGLMTGERVEGIVPSDGKVTIASGGFALKRGATASTEGTKVYTLTTNLHRTFNTALTATNDVVAPLLTVPTAITILEGPAWSLQITADDPDAEISLLPEYDADLFTFTGGLLSLPSLDYETPLDDATVSGANTYVASLQMKDKAGNTRVQQITVTVTDDPEAAAPTNTVAPAISGSPVVGQQLTGTDGTWVVPTPVTYTLDTLAIQPSLSLSLRKSRSAYNGPLVKVRRSLDNAVQDFGFGSDGVLDMAAVLAFTGTTVSSAGYVETWYDQSGNGYHATQAVQASQPYIVNAGAFVLSNGKPQIIFNNNISLAVPTLEAGKMPRSFRLVGAKRTTPNSDFIKSSANGGPHIRLGATTHPLQLLKQGSSVIATSAELAAVNIVSTMAVDVDVTSFAVNIDGGDPMTGTHNLPFTAGGTLILGGSSTVANAMQSVNVFDGILSTNDSVALQTAQKNYYGTA